MSKRTIRNGLALCWAVLYLGLLLAYIAGGHLSIWTIPTVFGALYLADLAGGIGHFVVDYTPNARGVGLYELFHYKGKKGDKDYKARRRVAMSKINVFHELIFDFKVHHLTPGALGRRPVSQITMPIILFVNLPVTVILVGIEVAVGFPPNALLCVLVLLGAGTLSQYAHAATHRKDVSVVVRLLQRTRLFITPQAHDAHHRDPMVSFCLLNGWANPVVDRLFRGAVALGVFDDKGLEVVR